MNRRVIVAAIISIVIIILLGIFLLPRIIKQTSEDVDVDSGVSVESVLQQAIVFEVDGELLQAQQLYQGIIGSSPNFEKIQEVEEKLGSLNIRIITSGIQTDQTTIYEIKPNDNLIKIAKKFNTTVELIKKSNNLKSDIIRVGKRLRIWEEEFSCLVDKSQNILILKSADKIIKTYRISTGINNSTPVGVFSIVNKLIDPVWYKAGAVVSADSPENILGTRWMGFDLAGYGIHGTTDPDSIGTQVTQGCVRMVNSEVEELYMLLPIGIKVTVVD